MHTLMQRNPYERLNEWGRYFYSSARLCQLSSSLQYDRMVVRLRSVLVCCCGSLLPPEKRKARSSLRRLWNLFWTPPHIRGTASPPSIENNCPPEYIHLVEREVLESLWKIVRCFGAAKKCVHLRFIFSRYCVINS